MFGKKQNNDELLIDANEKFTIDYENTRDINFTSIFSNKLANYVVNDSNIDLIGDDKRSELLKKIAKKLRKKLKKIVSRELGTGGVLVIPYVANKNIYYNIIKLRYREL